MLWGNKTTKKNLSKHNCEKNLDGKNHYHTKNLDGKNYYHPKILTTIKNWEVVEFPSQFFY